jgi:hypothetical protein
MNIESDIIDLINISFGISSTIDMINLFCVTKKRKIEFFNYVLHKLKYIDIENINDDNNDITKDIVNESILYLLQKINTINNDDVINANKTQNYCIGIDDNLMNELCELNNKLCNANDDIMMNNEVKTKMYELCNNIIPFNEVKRKLIKYEMRNYKNDDKLKFSLSNYDDVCSKIINDIQKFSFLVAKILEDEWNYTIDNTCSFIVPNNSVVFYNTIATKYINDDEFETFSNDITDYLENKYDSKYVTYTMVEDNEYSFVWIFIVIGYHV